MRCFDIVIIGGGLVGAVAARELAMANLGLNIAVIDQLPAHALYTAAADNRGLALGLGTKVSLERINVWHKLSANVAPIDEIHISQQGTFAKMFLRAAEYDLTQLGYVVSASNLGEALLQDLDTVVTVLRPIQVTKVEFISEKSTWRICSSTAEEFTASLLLIADGSNSSLRSTLGVTMNTVDHQQTAIVTNLHLQKDNFITAYERFVGQSILAILPFKPKLAKCVLTVPNSEISMYKNLDDEQFAQAMQDMFAWRLGKIVSCTERKYFPLQQSVVNNLVGPGFILLGNAAHTLHPVAAQGFNLGVREAVTLSKVLRKACQRGEKINASNVLHEYASSRKRDTEMIVRFTDSLVRGFALEGSLMLLLRDVGLLVGQTMPWFKRTLVKQGAGLCV